MQKKRAIEELLEASSKERKAALGQDDLKMPDAMRVRLQQEVARERRSVGGLYEAAEAKRPVPIEQSSQLSAASQRPPTRKEPLAWFPTWWPRMAMAAAAALLVAIPIWLQFRISPEEHSERLLSATKSLRAQEQSLALNESRGAKTPVAPQLAPKDERTSLGDLDKELKLANTVTAGSLQIQSDGKSLVERQPTSAANIPSKGPKWNLATTDSLPQSTVAEMMPSAPKPLATKDISSKPEAPLSSSLDKGIADQSLAAVGAPNSLATLPPLTQTYSNSIQASGGTVGGGLAFREQNAISSRNAFANQIEANQAKRKAALNILNTFDFEQSGNRIKVVDSDGSTYTGEIQPEPLQSPSGTLGLAGGLASSANSAPNSPSTNSEPSQQLRFRATGSNRTLKKPVLIEATCILAPEQSQQLKLQQQPTENTQLQAPSRIIGVAHITGEPEIQVDAAPVPLKK